MKLFVLIVCLLIERYLHIGNILRRFSWLERYLTFLQEKIGRNSPFSRGVLGVIVALLPLCIPIIFLNVVVVERQIGLSGAGLYFVILLYCFGPTDLYYHLFLYFKAEEEKDKEHQVDSYNEFIGNEIEEGNDLEPLNEKNLTESIFVRANCGIFGIVFWFCLGPLVLVVIYRVLCLMASFVKKEKEVTIPYANAASFLYGWYNWLPARVLAFLYVAAGGFQAFSSWKNYFWTGPKKNQTILVECGKNSLSKDKKMTFIAENKEAIALVNRAIVFFLVVILVFFLGSMN